MKLARPIWISAAIVVVLLLISLVVLFNASFQTWVVHRELASHPALRVTVGRVSAGFHHVELTDVRISRQGMQIVAPSVTAEVAVLPAIFSHRVEISRLTASGWTVRANPAIASGIKEGTGTVDAPKSASTALDAGPPVSDQHGFSGLFPTVQLPFDLSIDALSLTGRVVLSGQENAANVSVVGGNIGAGRDGKLDLTTDAILNEQPVKSLKLTGNVIVAMDTPRTFARASAAFDATAAGGQLAKPVSLHIDFKAARTAQGEKYSAIFEGVDRQLLALQAEFAAPGNQISGSWEIDLRDADVAPFMIGKALPSFTAVGRGTLDLEKTFTALHAVGRLQAAVDHLSVLKPELAGIGPVKLTADVDFAEHGDVVSVNNLDVALAVDPSARQQNGMVGSGGSLAAQQVGTIRSLQLFEFNPKSGELRATDPARDLIGLVFQGIPVNWAKPFFTGYAVRGGTIRGEILATPRAGGLTFRSNTPLSISDLSLSGSGRDLLRNVDLSLSLTGDYTPQGWQAELSSGVLKSRVGTIAQFGAKAGRLSEGDQPIKATGSLRISVGALASQPVAENILAATQGEALIDFTGSLDSKKELQAKVSVTDLAAGVGTTLQRLPSITGTVRADISAAGQVVLNAPMVIDRAGQQSDVTIAGTFSHRPNALVFDAQVTSGRLVVADAKMLTTAISRPPSQPASATPTGASTTPPIWTGLEGILTLQLKNLVYSDSIELNNVAGTLRFSGGTVKLDNVRAAMSDGGNAQANGALAFDSRAKQPYALGADIALTDFNPGPLFAAVSPGLPPTVDGRFSLTTKVSAKGFALKDLPEAATGDFEFTSKGGTFRGLSVSVGNLVENSSKLGTWLAAAGNAITSLWARKDYDEITSRSQAASELAKILSAIAYDQLSIVFTRDEEMNSRVKDFTLISPEIRITGSGFARSVPEHSILNDIVTLELHLRARGRPAELLKYLGVLEAKPDDLGYAACTIPIRVEGTLARLDTMQLSNRLVALAVEKTGLTEKAIDWINRLRGKTETR